MDMIENLLGSVVMTEADLGPSSRMSSPKYSPGPMTLSRTSLPSSSARYTLTRPESTMYIESLRSPSLTITVFFG